MVRGEHVGQIEPCDHLVYQDERDGVPRLQQVEQGAKVDGQMQHDAGRLGEHVLHVLATQQVLKAVHPEAQRLSHHQRVHAEGLVAHHQPVDASFAQGDVFGES